MSQLHSVSMLVPRYVSEFECSGPLCPDSCCKGFVVHIDQQTFRDYRHSKNLTLRPMFKLHLQRNEKGSNTQAYGLFELNKETQACSFQADSGWCEIQRQLGEEKLPDVCFSYPRRTYQLDGHFEQTMTLSCPEAARLALTLEGAFDFLEQVRPVRADAAKALLPERGVDIARMEDVRIFSVQICQSNELSLVHKLLLLGWMCARLDEVIANVGSEGVASVLTEMQNLLDQGVMHDLAEEMPFLPDRQAKIFSILFSMIPANAGDSSWRSEVFETVSRGLGGDTGVDAAGMVSEQVLVERYTGALNILHADKQVFEQVLSRFLLNEVLTSLFPWAAGGVLLRFRKLLTQYGIVRFMLVACVAERGAALSMADSIRVVQVFSRTYQHSSQFAMLLAELLEQGEWSELSKLFDLFRHD